MFLLNFSYILLLILYNLQTYYKKKIIIVLYLDFLKKLFYKKMKVLVLILLFGFVFSDFHCKHIQRNNTIYRTSLKDLQENEKRESNQQLSFILNKGNGIKNNEKAFNAFSLAARIWEL